MGNYLLSFISVALFCICCRQLILSLMAPIPLAIISGYSRKAKRVERGYKVLAWSVLCVVLLIQMISSFIDVFDQPYIFPQ